MSQDMLWQWFKPEVQLCHATINYYYTNSTKYPT